MDAHLVRVEKSKERLTIFGGVEWEGNKFADIRKPDWSDNARHCITGKRTIDGMCLDRVAPRFQQSQGKKVLQTESARRRFHVDVVGPVRLSCFCN